MHKSLYKLLAILALIPFVLLTIFGRLSELIGTDELIIISLPVTLIIAIAIAFLGALASRKAGYMNLNAVHGVIGALEVAMLNFHLFPNWVIALVATIILAPVAYILITGPKNNFRKPHNNPETGEPVISEVTVWDVMTGKWNPEDGPQQQK